MARGKAAPTCSGARRSQTRALMHGDDLVAGPKEGVDRKNYQHKLWYEVKVGAILRPDADDDKDLVVRGQAVRWTHEGAELEADEKHSTLRK